MTESITLMTPKREPIFVNPKIES